MSLYNSFDKSKHFSELASPLSTAEGVLTPQQRRARAQANLGSILGLGATGSGAGRHPVPAPATAADTVTLTATQIANGMIVATPTAAASYTLPTGTIFETQLAALGIVLGVDEGFDFSIINVATNALFDITILTAASWTLVGGMVIESNEATSKDPSGMYRVRKTATNTYTLYRVA